MLWRLLNLWIEGWSFRRDMIELLVTEDTHTYTCHYIIYDKIIHASLVKNVMLDEEFFQQHSIKHLWWKQQGFWISIGVAWLYMKAFESKRDCGRDAQWKRIWSSLFDGILERKMMLMFDFARRHGCVPQLLLDGAALPCIHGTKNTSQFSPNVKFAIFSFYF